MDEPSFHDIHPDLLNPRHPIPILLAGCGGTGSQVLTGLARIDHALKAMSDFPGFHLVAVDPDTVSESNVGRQLFSPADVGRNKASALVERVNRFFGLGWDALPMTVERLAAEGHITPVKQPKILITCVDTGAARKRIAPLVGGALYWLDLGNSATTAQAVLGTPQKIAQASREAVAKLPTILDLYPDLERYDDADQTPSCSMRQALLRQDLFVNQFAATAGLDLIWKMFRAPRLTIHGCFLDTGTLSSRPLFISGKK